MRRRSWTLTTVAAGAAMLPAALAVIASGSCSLAYLYSGADAGEGGGSASSSSGAGPDGGPDADAGDALTCPDGMVYVSNGKSSYCIDGLEVTNLAYEPFLADPDAGKGPADVCDWNASVDPLRPVDAGDALPVLGVDWCDAYAFCTWAGKRLCGDTGGGSTTYTSRDNTTDQWYFACSDRGTRSYPYTGSFDASACDDCTRDGGCGLDASPAQASPADAGAKSGCQGGFHGLFDMSGNAWEWEDACEHVVDDAGKPDPRHDVCYRRGGGYLTSETECLECFSMSCTAAGATRDALLPDVGFRCCLGP